MSDVHKYNTSLEDIIERVVGSIKIIDDIVKLANILKHPEDTAHIDKICVSCVVRPGITCTTSNTVFEKMSTFASSCSFGCTNSDQHRKINFLKKNKISFYKIIRELTCPFPISRTLEGAIF